MALYSGLPYVLVQGTEHDPEPAPDDAQLILRSQCGDLQAFNLLIERYQRRVFAVCRHMLGSADAEDATQDTFIAAFRGIQRYRGGSFVAWLLRIASNRCLDLRRAQRRRPGISLDWHNDEDNASSLHLYDRSEGPEQRVLRAELAYALQRTLRELPGEQRLAVILSDIQGYSHEEIIAATGWQPGTVKSRLSRARARLRDALRQGNILDACPTPQPVVDPPSNAIDHPTHSG